jgi:hypothetical protein
MSSTTTTIGLASSGIISVIFMTGFRGISGQTILPRPLIPRNPVIKITDIIPDDARPMFSPFDESRTMELHMEEYSRFLNSGRQRLAAHRAIELIRKRINNGDGDYTPS